MFMGGEVKLNFSDSTERSGVDPLSESSPFIAFMFISYSPRVRQLTGWSSKSFSHWLIVYLLYCPVYTPNPA